MNETKVTFRVTKGVGKLEIRIMYAVDAQVDAILKQDVSRKLSGRWVGPDETREFTALVCPPGVGHSWYVELDPRDGDLDFEPVTNRVTEGA
jgi:hypothetical protein